MEVDLAGSVAVVAGDGGRLGEALSARLAANGASVERIAQSANALAAAIARRGQVDILVNIAHNGVSMNAGAIEQLCRTAAKAMSQPGGRIVNVASAFGLVAARGESSASATAAAIFSLTRSLALELGGAGVRVNALAVGAIGEAKTERLVSHAPLARPGTVDEVAAAMLFLVDPDNSYTTGHVLAVDGGWTAGYARNF